MSEININSKNIAGYDSDGDGQITGAELGLSGNNLKVKLNIANDVADNASIKLNLSDIDIDRLDINDSNATDIELIVADSDGLIIDRTVSGKANANGTSDLGTLSVNDTLSDGLTGISNTVKVKLGKLNATKLTSAVNSGLTGETATGAKVAASNYNVNSGVTVSGDAQVLSSNINIAGGETVSQTDANVNNINQVYFNVTGGAGYTTEVNYDVKYINNIQNTGGKGISTSKLSNMAAGTEVFINQTGGKFYTTGAVKVNVASVLGDSQAESFARQLANHDQTVQFSWKGKSYMGAELAEMLRGSGAADVIAAISGAKTQTKYKKGNATGQWHTDITLTTDPAKATHTVLNKPNTGNVTLYIPKALLTQINQSLGSGSKLVTGKSYHHINQSPYDNITVNGETGTLADWLCFSLAKAGITVGNKKLEVMTTDSYTLNLGLSAAATGTAAVAGIAAGACRNCDPVAMIHINNLGGEGSLYAEATNEATIQDFRGSTQVGTVADAAFSYEFRTGVTVAKSAESKGITSYVKQDTHEAAGLKQDRSGIKMTGGFYDQAATHLEKKAAINKNTGGLDLSKFLVKKNATVVSALMTYIQSNNIDMTNPGSWTAEFCNKLKAGAIAVQTGVANNVMDIYLGYEGSGMSATNSGAALSQYFAGANSGKIDIALVRLGFGIGQESDVANIKLISNLLASLAQGQKPVLDRMATMGKVNDLVGYFINEGVVVNTKLAASLVATNDVNKISGVINAGSDKTEEVITSLISTQAGSKIGNVLAGITDQKAIGLSLTELGKADYAGKVLDTAQAMRGHLGVKFTINASLADSIFSKIGKKGVEDKLVLGMLRLDGSKDVAPEYAKVEKLLDHRITDGHEHKDATINFLLANIGDQSYSKGCNTYVVDKLLEGNQVIKSAFSGALIDRLLTGLNTGNNTFSLMASIIGSNGNPAAFVYSNILNETRLKSGLEKMFTEADGIVIQAGRSLKAQEESNEKSAVINRIMDNDFKVLGFQNDRNKRDDIYDKFWVSLHS